MAEEKREIVVFYDGPTCKDGGLCAWIFQEEFGKDPNVSLKLFPVHHAMGNGKRIEEIKKNITPESEVYVVDLSLKPEEYDDLMSVKVKEDESHSRFLKSLTTYDHHKTTAQALKDYTPPKFDDVKGIDPPEWNYINDPKCPSAAELVWRQLRPEDEIPFLVKFIGKMEPDGVLENDDERAIAAYVDSRQTAKNLDEFTMLVSRMNREDMVRQGQSVLEDQIKNYNYLIDNTMWTYLQVLPNRDKIWVRIAQVSPILFGRGVDAAMLKHDKEQGGPGIFLFCSVDGKSGMVQVSVRVDEELMSMGFDAGDIATHLGKTIGVGGGGHGKGAAFQIRDQETFLRLMRPVTSAEKRQKMHAAQLYYPDHSFAQSDLTSRWLLCSPDLDQSVEMPKGINAQTEIIGDFDHGRFQMGEWDPPLE